MGVVIGGRPVGILEEGEVSFLLVGLAGKRDWGVRAEER